MGRDKALLPWRDGPLVEAAVSTLQQVAWPVSLVGEPDRYRDLKLPCFADLRPGLGPLGGLESALMHSHTDLNLIATCDTPGLSAEWLAALVARAAGSAADCVIVRDSSGREHPLCGVYRRRCLPMIQSALDAGRLRVLSLLEELDVEWFALPLILQNINTPNDWDQWQKTAR